MRTREMAGLNRRRCSSPPDFSLNHHLPPVKASFRYCGEFRRSLTASPGRRDIGTLRRCRQAKIRQVIRSPSPCLLRAEAASAPFGYPAVTLVDGFSMRVTRRFPRCQTATAHADGVVGLAARQCACP